MSEVQTNPFAAKVRSKLRRANVRALVDNISLDEATTIVEKEDMQQTNLTLLCCSCLMLGAAMMSIPHLWALYR